MSEATQAAGRSMAGGRLVANSDNKNTSPEMKNSTAMARLPAAAALKVHISPSQGWTIQPHRNTSSTATAAPKVAPHPMPVSQAETMRRTLNTMRSKGITSNGKGVGY